MRDPDDSNPPVKDPRSAEFAWANYRPPGEAGCEW